MPSCTLADYYKGFASLSGGVTGILAAVPIASELTNGTVSAMLFPPIGSYYHLPALLLILILNYAIFESRTAPWMESARGRRRALWIALGIAFVGTLGVVASYSRLVVEMSAGDQSAYVAVGFERQDVTDAHLKNVSDAELLKYRGLTDSDLKTIWTTRSLIVSRIILLISYLLVLLPLIAASSLMVLFGVIGPAPFP